MAQGPNSLPKGPFVGSRAPGEGPCALLAAADEEREVGSPDPRPTVGTVLADRYELLRPLGSGTSGSAHLARDQRLGRPVVVKLLDRTGPDDLLRFRREARLTARLRHPAIVVLHELHADDDPPFLVTEWVDGGTLARGGLGRRRMVEVARTIAAALQHAHENGVVHRDLKPENILVDSAGRPHLIDFGLARDLSGRSGETLSLYGQIAGTPWCMAPEQARGDVERVDGRSDLWALGATLYWGLTGRRPFGGETLVDVLHAVLHDEPTPLRALDPRISPELERVVLRCLRKDPDDRYPTAAELVRDLDHVLGRASEESAPSLRGLVDLLRRGVRRLVRVSRGSSHHPHPSPRRPS